MEKDKKLQSLKSNPIFQLSLASKELFHSNFLYWLSQDENLKGLFQKVISSLCDNKINWNKLGGYVVLREYKNFDLCICKKNNGSTDDQDSADKNLAEDSDPFYDDIKQAGEIVFVLENKFKSIAYKDQLDKYYEKACQITKKIVKVKFEKDNNFAKLKKDFDDASLTLKEFKKKNNLPSHPTKKQKKETIGYNELEDKKNKAKDNYEKCKNIRDRKITNTTKPIFVLLSLAKQFPDKEKIENWKIKNYKQYAGYIEKSLKNTISINNVSVSIINEYIAFIKLFSTSINAKLKVLDQNGNWSQVYNDQNFKPIRCSDIWQKMAMHMIAQELMGKKGIQDLINSQGFLIDTDSSDDHCRKCSKNNLDNYNKTIFIGVQYFHSLALLEIKYRIDKNCMFVIQQQGNSLCAGIDVLQNRGKYLDNKYRKDNNWSDLVDEKLFQGFNLIYILANSDKINSENTIKVNNSKHKIKISNKSNGKIPAYENEKGGFYYKNIILNPSDKSKDNGNSTINDTLDYMVECLKRAIE